MNKEKTDVKVVEKHGANNGDPASTSNSNERICVLAFDLDGTLCEPNTKPVDETQDFFRNLRKIDGKRLKIVLVTGKSVNYARKKMGELGRNADLVIAENGASYQQKRGPVECSAPSECIADMHRLRALIGLGPREGVQTITLSRIDGQVAIEECKTGVLTIFTDHDLVKGRWPFTTCWNRQKVYRELWHLIGKYNLHLHVLEPHGDGAVDVVCETKDDKPLDKSVLLDVLKKSFTGQEMKVAMFGDGWNDVPAMSLTGVIGVTFKSKEEKDPARDKVINAVKATGGEKKKTRGIVTDHTAPNGGGVEEGIQKLAEAEFFLDNWTESIKKLCTKRLQEIDQPVH